MTTPARQTGFSLVELMIAGVLGLLLLAGVVTITMNSSRTQRAMEQVGRQVENGRYAIATLREAVEHAGYYGEYYNLAGSPGSLPNPCSTTLSNLRSALPLPIQGYDDPSGAPPITCLTDAEHRDGTDILVLRRASTAATTDPSTLTAGEVYLQTRATNRVLDTGGSGSFTLTKRDGTTTANIRKYHVEIYFIGPDADNVPTLKRLVLRQSGGALGFSTEELVSGIEYFEVEYGIDRTGDGSPNPTAAGAGDAYVTTPTLAQLADTVALKINIIARSIDTFPGYNDEKTYALGQETDVGPLNDGYRRRAYSTTVRANNIALRRE